MKLLGYATLDFTSSDGKVIKGTSVYAASEDENVKGLRADKLFLREDINLPDGVKVGDTIDVTFNMKGKPESVQLAK